MRNAVLSHKGKNWKKIAEHVKDRTDVQCLHRWQKVLNPELVKGPWTKEVWCLIREICILSCSIANVSCIYVLFRYQQEDEMVVKLVEKYGPKRWSLIASQLKGRIGKQCRERYASFL